MSLIVIAEIRKERLEACIKCPLVVKPSNIETFQDAMQSDGGILKWWTEIRCKVCNCGIRPKTLLGFSNCPRRKWKR